MNLLDRSPYEGLHPSDQLALYFHAVLRAPNEDARRTHLATLDAWIADLGPTVRREDVLPLLAACGGTLLEPMRLGNDAMELAARFVQIVFSEIAGGSHARIVSEETLGISGGLSFASGLGTHYIERYGGKEIRPGEKGDWYFAPAGLRNIDAVETALIKPLCVNIQSSPEHGFLLSVSLEDATNLHWNSVNGQDWDTKKKRYVSKRKEVRISELATDLEKNSRLSRNGDRLDTLLTRLPGNDNSLDTTLEWAPLSAEAIVRFSALLATGQALRLDPGDRYSGRSVVTIDLSLPEDESTGLRFQIKRNAPTLIAGLWADLSSEIATLPLQGLSEFVAPRAA